VEAPLYHCFYKIGVGGLARGIGEWLKEVRLNQNGFAFYPL
jgi:threonine dehydratase